VLGASDAFGVGTFDPDRENWPARLADDLPQPTHLVNLGIPGATLAQAQQEELPIATAQHPQIMVIWLVVNDIIDNVPLATYSTQLRATLATIRNASPATQVFVGNVPDLTQLPYFDGRDTTSLQAQIDAWNAAIAQDCAAEGARLADLASAWGQFIEHPEYISRDGLHPSDEGAQALANFFDIVIRRDLQING
jgi:lysophospholipase L1-like esterase